MNIRKIRRRTDKYRMMQLIYDFIGLVSILTMLIAKFLNISLEQEKSYVVIGMLLLWICVIGDRYYTLLEHESIKEERKEAKKILEGKAS